MRSESTMVLWAARGSRGLGVIRMQFNVRIEHAPSRLGTYFRYWMNVVGVRRAPSHTALDMRHGEENINAALAGDSLGWRS